MRALHGNRVKLLYLIQKLNLPGLKKRNRIPSFAFLIKALAESMSCNALTGANHVVMLFSCGCPSEL